MELCPSDLRCVRSAIFSVRHKWHDIGIELDIPFQTLNAIEADCPNNSAACLRKMLEEWLSTTSPAPSWSALVEALSSEPVKEKRLAEEIRTQYCVDCDETDGGDAEAKLTGMSLNERYT